MGHNLFWNLTYRIGNRVTYFFFMDSTFAEIMNKTLTICMRIFMLRHVIWRRCESLILYQIYVMFQEYVCRLKYQVVHIYREVLSDTSYAHSIVLT